MSTVMSPAAALAKLQQGNELFVETLKNDSTPSLVLDQAKANSPQRPFAVILSCADSRVPPEHIFNCGLGELFTIRVAGNLVAPTLVGSIEFACESFGTPLVVVMGHSQCGAVNATLDALINKTEAPSPGLESIVQRISVGIKDLVDEASNKSVEALMPQAIDVNIDHSVQKIIERSVLLEKRVENQELEIVGANYSLETGRVEFHTK
ncbi:MAG: carbonic anhydrase [Pseudomonadota bacterium]